MFGHPSRRRRAGAFLRGGGNPGGGTLQRPDGLSQPVAAFLACLGLVACLHPATVQADTYRARGQDPNWTLAIGPRTMTLVTDRGALRLDAATPPPETDGDETTYRTVSGPAPVTVAVKRGICRDSADSTPFPDTVIVTVGERTFWGCGGDPARLLQGTAWRVTRIGGTPTPGDGRPTLEFRADGRLAGNAGCNAYSAGYTVTGDRIVVTEAVSTRKACATEIMDREAAFLSLLAGVRGYEVGKDDTLVLIADDGRRLWARRP